MELERSRLKRRIDVAMGRIPGDLVITGCHIIDVYTQTIYKGDILIAGFRQLHRGKRLTNGLTAAFFMSNF